MATIPLIDDEEQVRLILQVALAGPGYLVLAADDGQHGLRLFQRQEVDLILVDIFMPEPDGLDLIPRLDSTRPPARLLQYQAALGGTISTRRGIWGRTTRSRSRSVCRSCWRRLPLN